MTIRNMFPIITANETRAWSELESEYSQGALPKADIKEHGITANWIILADLNFCLLIHFLSLSWIAFSLLPPRSLPS